MTIEVEYPVYEEIRSHTRELGGTTTLTIGRKGSGKTTWLMLQARNQLKKGEVCLWYGREYADWLLLRHHFPIKVFLPRGGLYRLYRMGEEPGTEEPLDLLNFAEEVAYERWREVLDQAEPDVLNVFYTLEPDDVRKPHPALGIFEALVKRLDFRWVSLFMDEVDEVFPEWPQGERFWEQARAKDRIKDLRKRYVSWYACTQAFKDVDHRILTKFQYFVYLKGAMPVHSSLIPRYFTARLLHGRGIIESGGWFQYFRFPPVKKGQEYALKLVGTVEGDLR